MNAIDGLYILVILYFVLLSIIVQMAKSEIIDEIRRSKAEDSQ